jgi:hypothetical protein
MFYEWPNQVLPSLPTICPLSPSSIAPGFSGTALATFASAALTANRAYLVPFHLEEPILVTKLFSANGATNVGNIDVGIYSDSFVRITSSGSTAQAGVNTLQVFNVTDVIIGPGDFYLAIAASGAATVFQANLGVPTANRVGMLQMASAFPLPATITPATVSAGTCPIIGLLQGGTAI